MNPIYIDDKYLESFANCKTMKDLAEGIKAKEDAAIKNDVVFFISVNFIFNNSKRQEQKGMELLIWLRLINVNNHCVLYSFESLHALLKREPKYLIATSKGTSFMQMPFVFDAVDVTELKSDTAKLEDSLPALKNFFTIDEFRHREANLWGIKCLWDALKLIDSNFKEDYPKLIQDTFDAVNLEVIQNVYFKKDYAKGFPNPKLLSKIQAQLSELHSLSLSPNVILIDDQADEGWSKIISKMIYGNKQSSDVKNYFNVIAPKKSDTVKTVFTHYTKVVSDSLKNGKYIDLVIMDLRLLDEVGVRKDVYNLSGIELFKAIRQKNKNIPILIITASNKVNVFSFLYEMKDTPAPNGFWIKEGIDFHNYENDKLHSYLLLSTQINNLIKQKRKSRYVSAFTLQSYNNEQSKIKALEIVNNGFPDVLSDCNGVKFDATIQSKFNQTYCIIDTNIFIKSNLDELFDYSQSIILLSALRNQIKVGKIGVHINVFAEILKFGMAANDELINLVARKTHKNLQLLYSKKELEIIIPNAYLNNSEKLEVVITGLNPYADDALFAKSKALIEGNNSLIFISDDKKPDGTAAQLKSFLDKKPQFKPNATIIDGKEMVANLRSYIDAIISPNTP